MNEAGTDLKRISGCGVEVTGETHEDSTPATRLDLEAFREIREEKIADHFDLALFR
jgi:hypothetical protein